MADEVVRLRIVVDEDVRGAKKAKAAVDDVTKSTDKLGDQFKESSREAKSFEERLKDLTAQKQEYARKALDADDEDRRAHIRRYNAISREIGLLHKLKDVADEAFGNDDDRGLAFRGTGIPALSLSGAAPATGAMIATGAAGLAPAAIYGTAAVGAGLAGAIGGVGVIAGLAGAIAASIKSPEVQAAAKGFGSTLSSEFFGAGGASVKPVVESLHMLEGVVKDLDLSTLFGKAAPAITIFAGGIGDLVTNLMPGFNRLMDDAEPYAEALADGLGDTGAALGNLFATIADSKGDIEGLRGLFDLINGTVNTTGATVGWLSDRWYEMNVMLGHVTGALEDVYPSFMPAHTALAHGNDLTEQYTDSGEGAVRVIRELNTEVRDQAVALRLADLATVNATENMKNYADWLQKTKERLDDELDSQMDFDKAVLSYKEGLRQLKEQLKENPSEWDANTEAGNRNRQALLDQIEAAKRLRDAQIELGGNTESAQQKAQKEYNKTVMQLLALAKQAGLTKRELESLADKYTITISSEILIGRQVVDWSKLRTGERKAEGRASGGPVFAGVPYMINEAGRETVTFGANGMVHPANLSPAGSGAFQMTVKLDPSISGPSRSLAESLLHLLRFEIGIQGGGNVQLALGRN